MYSDTPTHALLQKIAEQQAIQKTCHWKSAEWQKASKQLEPMFAEMARRQNTHTERKT